MHNQQSDCKTSENSKATFNKVSYIHFYHKVNKTHTYKHTHTVNIHIHVYNIYVHVYMHI